MEGEEGGSKAMPCFCLSVCPASFLPGCADTPPSLLLSVCCLGSVFVSVSGGPDAAGKKSVAGVVVVGLGLG